MAQVVQAAAQETQAGIAINGDLVHEEVAAAVGGREEPMAVQA